MRKLFGILKILIETDDDDDCLLGGGWLLVDEIFCLQPKEKGNFPGVCPEFFGVEKSWICGAGGRWCGCAAGSLDTGWRGVILGRFCLGRNLKMGSN